MKIALSTESTCDLPKELLEKYKLEMIPYSVIIGDDVVEDNADVPARIFEYVETTTEEYNQDVDLSTEGDNTSATYNDVKGNQYNDSSTHNEGGVE